MFIWLFVSWQDFGMFMVDYEDIKQEVTNQDNRVSYKFEMNT